VLLLSEGKSQAFATRRGEELGFSRRRGPWGLGEAVGVRSDGCGGARENVGGGRIQPKISDKTWARG
jgi:hypothetical protein